MHVVCNTMHAYSNEILNAICLLKTKLGLYLILTCLGFFPNEA